MGRWAQRRRSGGSPSPPLPAMIAAIIADDVILQVTYDGPVDASLLVPSAFQSEPSLETGVSVDALTSNIVQVTMTGIIAADVDLTYDGPRGYVQTPQTVAIT